MSHMIWIFFLVLGNVTVFAQELTSSYLDVFLSQCNADLSEYTRRCARVRCFRLISSYAQCGFNEFLDKVITIEGDITSLDETVKYLTNANLVTEQNFEFVWETFETLTLNISRMESEADFEHQEIMTSISTISSEIEQMGPQIEQLKTSQEEIFGELASLSLQQMNTTTNLALVSTQVDSQGDQIQELYQSVNALNSSLVEINENVNFIMPRIDNLETWQQCAENETQCLRNDVDCLQETCAENTATIANLTLLLDLLTNDIVMPAISTLNLLSTMGDMSNLTSDLACLREDLQNETLQREQLCTIVEDLNCTVNEMLKSFALMEQTQLEMAETCCNVSEKLCALELVTNETTMTNNVQDTKLQEIENFIDDHTEIIQNQTARICELETLIQAYEENITCQNERIDKLEAMLLGLEEKLMIKSESDCCSMVATLERQVEEMNSTLTTVNNDLCTQQELLAELTSQVNCRLTDHETRLCTLEAQICNPDCGNTTIGTVQGWMVALDAKLPDCPDDYIAIYRDPEHEIPPLCLKFEMKSEDFSTHEYHCQLQGLHLVEPIGDYTMLQLEEYIESMPDLQGANFFVGGTDRDTEGEWMWLKEEQPMACDWLDGEPSGGTDLNCASLNTTNFGLESCSCDSKSFAICQI